MGGEFHFVAVLLGDFLLPISDICVQSWEYHSIAQRGDTLLHVRYLVQVPYQHYVPFSVVDTEEKFTVLLWPVHDRWRPFCLGGFDDVYGEHPLDFLFFEFFCLTTGPIRGWMYRAVLRLFQFDSMLHHFIRYEMDIPSISKFRRYFDELLAISDKFMWHLYSFLLVWI